MGCGAVGEGCKDNSGPLIKEEKAGLSLILSPNLAASGEFFPRTGQQRGHSWGVRRYFVNPFVGGIGRRRFLKKSDAVSMMATLSATPAEIHWFRLSSDQ